MSVQTALRPEVIRKHQAPNLVYCYFSTGVQPERYNSGLTLRKPSVKFPIVGSGDVE